MPKITYHTKSAAETINIPVSKSFSNRILLLNALRKQKTPDEYISTADDSQLMNSILENLKSNPDLINNPIDCQNAGTVFRFISVYLAYLGRNSIVTGSSRMLERPIGELVDLLRSCGVIIEYQGKDGFPPIQIQGKLDPNENIDISIDKSSQHLSAFLLVAPFFKKDMTIKLFGKPVSLSYIDLTLKIMSEMGIKISRTDNIINLEQSEYNASLPEPDYDWSAAAFWYQILLLHPHSDSIILRGLKRNGYQGDEIIADIFSEIGIKTSFTDNGVLLEKQALNRSKKIILNIKNYPDIAPVLIVTLSVMGIEAEISGIANLRHKESNRAEGLIDQLIQNGASISVLEDRISIKESKFALKPNFTFNTFDDHRITMALTALSLIGDININETSSVSKSYPEFWNEAKKLGIQVST